MYFINKLDILHYVIFVSTKPTKIVHHLVGHAKEFSQRIKENESFDWDAFIYTYKLYFQTLIGTFLLIHAVIQIIDLYLQDFMSCAADTWLVD